jgi:hypothetical protein
MAPPPDRRWLAAAILTSAGVVGLSPMVGAIAALLRVVAKGQYVTLLGAIVAASALAMVLYALFNVRERRLVRYGSVAAGLGLALGYGFLTRSGIPDADAAERFHFVEYGLITFLFYKAWRSAGDLAIVVLPILATMLVGTLDEWLQWFVPSRVGEAKDVALNFFAGASGVLVALGTDPPARIATPLSQQSRRRIGLLASVALAVFAGFVHSVHLGHEIADREAGVFLSRYSESELNEVSKERASRWKSEPPMTWSRYSREDQYLTEAIAHVRRRNQQWDAGNLLAARQENLILEKYFAPVLDTPSYITNQGHRWAPEQRVQAERIPGPGFMIYESDALTYFVVTWPPAIYWLFVVVAILLTLRRTL